MAAVLCCCISTTTQFYKTKSVSSDGLVFMQKQMVIGTNCYNCLYISKTEEPVDPKELNEEGGIDPKNDVDMEKAKKADLITLPGGSKDNATSKKKCFNDKIMMYVTSRMCCGYWDNAAVKRPWKKK